VARSEVARAVAIVVAATVEAVVAAAATVVAIAASASPLTSLQPAVVLPPLEVVAEVEAVVGSRHSIFLERGVVRDVCRNWLDIVPALVPEYTYVRVFPTSSSYLKKPR